VYAAPPRNKSRVEVLDYRNLVSVIEDDVLVRRVGWLDSDTRERDKSSRDGGDFRFWTVRKCRPSDEQFG